VKAEGVPFKGAHQPTLRVKVKKWWWTRVPWMSILSKKSKTLQKCQKTTIYWKKGILNIKMWSKGGPDFTFSLPGGGSPPAHRQLRHWALLQLLGLWMRSVTWNRFLIVKSKFLIDSTPLLLWRPSYLKPCENIVFFPFVWTIVERITVL